MLRHIYNGCLELFHDGSAAMALEPDLSTVVPYCKFDSLFSISFSSAPHTTAFLLSTKLQQLQQHELRSVLGALRAK